MSNPSTEFRSLGIEPPATKELFEVPILQAILEHITKANLADIHEVTSILALGTQVVGVLIYHRGDPKLSDPQIPITLASINEKIVYTGSQLVLQPQMEVRFPTAT